MTRRTRSLVALAALGVALAHAIPNVESAPAYVNAVFLPVIVISGVFYDADRAPAWLHDLGHALPLTHLIDGLSGAMVHHEGLADHVTGLLCVRLRVGERRSAELVGSTLGDDVHDATCGLAELGLIATGLDLDFLDEVVRRRIAQRAEGR